MAKSKIVKANLKIADSVVSGFEKFKIGLTFKLLPDMIIRVVGGRIV